MNKRRLYIIEHLEDHLWRWCLIEYKHISQIVGRENLWITNVKRKSKASEELKQFAHVFKESIINEESIINLVQSSKLQTICVLDPEGKETLLPSEAKKFSHFIFGGILGDNPPQKRTAPELTSKLLKVNSQIIIRNLGKKQMSTDNAVYVVKQIVQGKTLSQLQFQDTLEIKMSQRSRIQDSIILPYYYCLVNSKPLISSELVQYLKKKKGF
jgi:ribosome biogenesis SPOUT family RNA methylase Rps3